MRVALLVPILVMAGAVSAAEEAEKPKPFVEPRTGVTFPVELGHLSLGQVHKFDKPGLGVAIRYETSERLYFRIDIYVYDLGKKGLGTGIASKEVKKQFQQAKADIQGMAKSGRYKGLKLLAEKPWALMLGKTPLLMFRVAFEFIIARRSGSSAPEHVSVSHLLLTAYKGQFLKVRATYPKAEKAMGDEILKDFLLLLGRTLHGKGSKGAASGS